MDPRDLFRGFFGDFRGQHHGSIFRDDEEERSTGDDRHHDGHDDGHDRHHDGHDDRHDGHLDVHGPGFHVEVFTNPLEMHKFFDRQMDEILKGFFSFGGAGPPGPPGQGQGHAGSPGGPAGSRDFMLKEGFGFSPAQPARKEDDDLDDDVGDLNKMFSEKKDHSWSNPPSMSPPVIHPLPPPPSSWLTPFFEMPRHQESDTPPSSFHFSEKTIRLPDGRVERHVTRSDGRQTTTTITKSTGDRTSTVTKVTGPDGRTTTTTEGDSDPNWTGRIEGDLWTREKSRNESIFDRFFGPS